MGGKYRMGVLPYGFAAGRVMTSPGRWLALILLGGMANAGWAAGVDLHFTGTLIDKQCTFAQEGGALQVSLPARAIKYFNKYGRTEAEPFDIVLKNCTGATQDKLVLMTFSAVQTQVVGGVTTLKTSGGTGVVIGLEDATGRLVSLGTPLTPGVIKQTGSAGENRFRFGAYAQAPDLAVLKEGRYTATTTFEVSYQ